MKAWFKNLFSASLSSVLPSLSSSCLCLTLIFVLMFQTRSCCCCPQCSGTRCVVQIVLKLYHRDSPTLVSRMMRWQGYTIISYLDHSESDYPGSAHGETRAGYQWEHRRQDCFKTIFPFQILFKAMEKFPQLMPQTFKFSCAYLLLFFF